MDYQKLYETMIINRVEYMVLDSEKYEFNGLAVRRVMILIKRSKRLNWFFILNGKVLAWIGSDCDSCMVLGEEF